MSQPYKRSIFIVNPSFQLKFSLMMCLLILLVSSIYPLVIYGAFDAITELSPKLKDSLGNMRGNLQMILILWQIGFGIVTFVICIFFTHKIAGPMYKLSKYLSELREGEVEGKLYFRGGDYFQDVADEVNETLEVFQDHFKEDCIYLNDASTYLKNLMQTVPDDKKVVIREVIERLNKMEERYENLAG